MRAWSAAAALTYTANFWRFHEIDFNERSVIGSIPGTGFADWPISYQELEPYYTKVDWEVGVSGLGLREPLRSAAQQALSHAAVAGEILGRAAGARRPQAGTASVSGADGHRVAAVSRPPGVRALRLLHGLRLRGAREVLHPVHHDSGSRGHRAAARFGQRASSTTWRPMRRGAPPACITSTARKRAHFQQARAVVLSANGAETTRLLLNSTQQPLPARAWRIRAAWSASISCSIKAPACRAVFEHELNEYKSVQVDAHPARFLRFRPETRVLRRRRHRRAHQSAAGYLGAGSAAANCRAGEPNSRRASRRSRAPWCRPATPPRCRVETNSVSIDPTLKDAWGIPAIRVTYKDHPDDLAFARFLQDRQVRDHAGGRGAKGLARRRGGERRRACICWERRGWAMIRPPR